MWFDLDDDRSKRLVEREDLMAVLEDRDALGVQTYHPLLALAQHLDDAHQVVDRIDESTIAERVLHALEEALTRVRAMVLLEERVRCASGVHVVSFIGTPLIETWAIV
jgi:hypothetical protein